MVNMSYSLWYYSSTAYENIHHTALHFSAILSGKNKQIFHSVTETTKTMIRKTSPEVIQYIFMMETISLKAFPLIGPKKVIMEFYNCTI